MNFTALDQSLKLVSPIPLLYDHPSVGFEAGVAVPCQLTAPPYCSPDCPPRQACRPPLLDPPSRDVGALDTVLRVWLPEGVLTHLWCQTGGERGSQLNRCCLSEMESLRSTA